MNFLDFTFDFLFPKKCLLCERISNQCPCLHCESQLIKINSPLCASCGMPFGFGQDDHLCAACIKGVYFDWHRSAVVYENPVSRYIHQLKYFSRMDLTFLFEGLLAPLLKNPLPFMADVIVPVPLSQRSLLKRKFNQSEFIGQIISKKVGVPCDTSLLFKSRDTPRQVKLTRSERLDNLSGAFRVSEQVLNKRILLVDDVMTTGSTINECARILKKGGAQWVGAITIAMTIEK